MHGLPATIFKKSSMPAWLQQWSLHARQIQHEILAFRHMSNGCDWSRPCEVGTSMSQIYRMRAMYVPALLCPCH